MKILTKIGYHIHIQLKRYNLLVLIGALSLLLFPGIFLYFLSQNLSILYFLLIILSLLGLAFISLNLKLDDRFNQVEAMFSTFSIVKPTSPLPAMHYGAMTPDALNIILSVIQDFKPQNILELGAGVSTILISYFIKQLDNSRLFSVEHDEGYYNFVNKLLARHQIQENTHLFFAPLQTAKLKGTSLIWYDTSFLSKIPQIDLLLIDGPPYYLQKLARYPALPVLFDKLSDGAVIIVDDAGREDEKKIVKLWRRDFQGLKYQWHETEKGLVILYKG